MTTISVEWMIHDSIVINIVFTLSNSRFVGLATIVANPRKQGFSSKVRTTLMIII